MTSPSRPPNSAASSPSSKSLEILSRLLCSANGNHEPASPDGASDKAIAAISREEFTALLSLANSNHVLVRGMEIALRILREAQEGVHIEWAETALAVERARIKNALSFLHEICSAFEEDGLGVTVIKSLDHWPDLGSDLDLYTNAEPNQVIQLMKGRFHARIASRSWGDRLAGKWNFNIPGLAEAVEVHVGRLGQTGEQLVLARRIVPRARVVSVGDYSFRVPAISDRLMISTLQRMYRHFYFRLCDIVDTEEISEANAIDFEDLRGSAIESGIWEGVATYLTIVSDYIRQYRGIGLKLPNFVSEAARFGGEKVFFARDFLHVPILPHSARLYGTQLSGLLRKRELRNSARLGLLPWLATAAAVGQKITGSDKGIW